MKKAMKIAGIVLLVLVVLIGAAAAYLLIALPNAGPAPDLKVSATSAQVERGRYLANHVTVCIDCHSTRDWSKFAGPPMAGTYGKGGERFDHTMGFPGVFYSKNITPAGIGNWTDGEVFRAITSGVDKDGKAIFPVMPHPLYGQLDQKDIEAIVAYLRTLEPIQNEIPKSKADFPFNLILNTIPSKPNLQPMPDPQQDEIAYGKYVITAAACVECHTPRAGSKLLYEKSFAGGAEFEMPGFGIIRSPNLRPDKKTGIGNWTRQAFINRFKMYADSAQHNIPVAQGEFNTIMPWLMYAGMTEQDLGAIYEYLMSLEPIEHNVVRIEKSSASR